MQLLTYCEKESKSTSRCSNSSIVIALIYINRVLGKWPGTVLHKLNIHRLIISSLLVAIKVNEDQYYKTKFYSEIGGISSEELIKLEINLLKLLEFDVAVSLETFEDYYKCLIGEESTIEENEIEFIKVRKNSSQSSLLTVSSIADIMN